MVRAELVDNNSTINLTVDRIGRAYIAVRFAELGNPTGKLVRFQKLGDSPAIRGWTNMIVPEGFRSLPWVTGNGVSVDQEHARFYTSSGNADLQIKVLKADSRTLPSTAYTPHSADAAAEVLLDTKFADAAQTYGLQVQQWKFSNGPHNQVIITIVMVDDEGGGNPSLLRFEINGDTFELEARRVVDPG